jgi:hypothetical protein
MGIPLFCSLAFFELQRESNVLPALNAAIIGIMKATYDDASLILRLYELRRDEALRKARSWFVGAFNAASAEEMMQKYPFGSEENTNTRMVLSYWDMACSFIVSGVLNQELFFESAGEMMIVWEKVRPLIEGFRKITGNPKSWGNLETVGTAYVEFMKSRGPGAYEGFQQMIARIAASAAAAR